MSTTRVIFERAVKVLVPTSGFSGLAVVGHVTERSQHRFFPVQFAKATRSGERLLVWMGAKILDGLFRFFRGLFTLLFSASADVALWAVDKSGPNVQRKVRSHLS